MQAKNRQYNIKVNREFYNRQENSILYFRLQFQIDRYKYRYILKIINIVNIVSIL